MATISIFVAQRWSHSGLRLVYICGTGRETQGLLLRVNGLDMEPLEVRSITIHHRTDGRRASREESPAKVDIDLASRVVAGE